ncbi:cohesin subunit SA-2-like [Ctenocephalides felis]|uniref:cohesin subunit SA-2-like n=1 Tax=Ctenocephalides felis TaxID=7515 RepID=UPI000E6E2DF9|nr:cohesin subunit SA-2-like [Ctenocephalides felis]
MTLDCLRKRVSISVKCDVVLSSIVNECAQKYLHTSELWQRIVDGEVDSETDMSMNEDSISVVNSVKKICIFYNLHNLNYLNLWPHFSEEINAFRNGIVGNSFPIEGAIYCLYACGAYLFWELQDLKSKNDIERAEKLKLNLEGYVVICNGIICNVDDDDMCRAAVLAICDLSLNFNSELGTNPNDIIHNLVLTLDSDTISTINQFTEEYVFTKHLTEGHDKDSNQISKRREVLERFCKIIGFNIIPGYHAAFVLKYYVKCNKCYGDIIKNLVARMRQLNLINSTLTMWLALSQMYTDLQTTLGDNKRPDGTVKEFAELKTLARYLSLMLGLDKTKNRDAILELHKAGILFAVDKSGNNKEPPIRLPFLEILSEFSGKLLYKELGGIRREVFARRPTD